MNKRKGYYCDMNRDDFIAWHRRLTGHASRDTAATEPIDYARNATYEELERLNRRNEWLAIALLAWLVSMALYALTW